MRRVYSALALTALVPLIEVGSALSIPAYDSTVTIKAERETEVFRGRVISDSAHCYVGRAVRVFRARAGRDLYLTRTFTNEAGKWRAIIPAQHAKHIYAKVREETVPPNGVPRARCSGDKSRTIVG
jgi:aromatic ring hydroxylase